MAGPLRRQGAFGVAYDSDEEARVSEVLLVLMQERLITSFIPHPNLCGASGDFLVAQPNGHLILVEYDGLQESREKSLEHKIGSYARLHEVGIELRWLLSPEEADVRRLFSSYVRPSYLWKIQTCPTCSQEQKILVLSRRHTGFKHEQKPCKTCGPNKN